MGTTAEKINYAINATNDIAEGINNIGGNITQNTELADFREELDKLYNELPKTSQDGTSITLANTRRGKIGIIPKGNTSQLYYQGNQMIDVSEYPGIEQYGLTVTVNSDNTLILNTNGATTRYVDIYIATTSPARNIDALNKMNTELGTYTFTNNLNLQSYFRWQTEGSDTPQYTPGTITLTEGQTVTGLFVRIWEGNVFNNDVLKVMVNTGSIASNWEPYTGGIASPNPDYPQDVKVVTGINNVKISGINLIDKDNEIRQGNSFDNTTQNRVSISLKAVLSANTTYTLVTNLDLTKFDYAFVLGTRKAPFAVGEIILDSGWRTDENNYTYIPSQDCYLNIPIKKLDDSNITPNDVKDYWFMLYEGSYDANIDFEPYIEPIEKELNLGNIELAKINDYSDLIFKNEITNPYYDNTLIENAWYKKEKIAKRILNGSENWQKGTPFYRFFITTDAKVQDIEPISDYFKGYKDNMPTNTNGIFLQQINNTTIRINLYNVDFNNNLTGFVNWLKSHNTTMYYLKDSSTYSNIQITEITLINQLEELNKVIGKGGTVVIETESESNNAPLIVSASALASFENE